MRRQLLRASESRPTGIVLWLMILVVFVPIAGMHGLARLYGDAPRTEPARHAASAAPAIR